MVYNDDENQTGKLISGICIDDADWDELQKRPDFVEAVHKLRHRMEVLIGADEFGQRKEIFSYESVGTALGKFVINSFNIADKLGQDMGCGIYLSGSTFDHSCWPNAGWFFTGPTIERVRTAQFCRLRQCTRCLLGTDGFSHQNV